MIDLDSTDVFKCTSVIRCDAMQCRVMVRSSVVDAEVERESKVTINLLNNLTAKVLFTFLRQTSSISNLHLSWMPSIMHSTALFGITFIHRQRTNERTNQLLIKRFCLGYWLPYAVNLLSCVSSFWCAHTHTHTARFIVTQAELNWTVTELWVASDARAYSVLYHFILINDCCYVLWYVVKSWSLVIGLFR